MGKQTDNSRSNTEPDDYELKVLIDKCNVCHSNLDITDHHKMCKHHGERRYCFDPFSFARELPPTHFSRFLIVAKM